MKSIKNLMLLLLVLSAFALSACSTKVLRLRKLEPPNEEICAKRPKGRGAVCYYTIQGPERVLTEEQFQIWMIQNTTPSKDSKDTKGVFFMSAKALIAYQVMIQKVCEMLETCDIPEVKQKVDAVNGFVEKLKETSNAGAKK